ncbi:MAG TPA: N-acetylmuramoyl-L-alanine amidase [Bacteroidia bacterium]|nr:N-acetylmuramoyl-L-alanine amidase [Bacteroidia bacterium]
MKKITHISLILLVSFLASSFLPKTKPAFAVRTVVIDPGHGGKDPGCHGTKYKEKDIALAVSLKLGHYIEEHIKDVKVVYTRKTDVFVELQERAEIANRAKADLFICIHCNSACVRDKKLKRDICNEEAHGAETYVMGIKNEKGKLDVVKTENSAMLLEDNYVKKYNGFDPNSDESYIIMSMFTDVYLTQSLSFASKIQKQYGTRTGRVDKGVKRGSLWVLWRTYMPSVLTEMGFLTNPEEEAFLGSTKGQDYIASGIFRAFREYKDEIEGVVKKYNDDLESQVPYKMSKEDSIQRDELKKEKTTTSKTETPVAIKPKEIKVPKVDSAETKKKENEEEDKPAIKNSSQTTQTDVALNKKADSKNESKPKETKNTPSDKAAYDKMKAKALEEASKIPVKPNKEEVSTETKSDKGDKKEAVETDKKIKEKETEPVKKEVKPVDTELTAPLVYKVQILSSDKKVPFNSPKLKGAEKLGEYVDKGVYKYTSGEFATPEEASKLQSELKKIGFKDAFVITTRNGKRITQNK